MSRREDRILVVVLLNVAFTVLEVAGGLWTNSLAILSDALHDFGDSVALSSSWFFERGAKREPDASRTFGYQRLSLFSALICGIVLVGGSLVILLQVVPRFFSPEVVDGGGMFGLALIGILFNGFGFFILKKGESVNEKVLSWHLFEDVVGWLFILVGAVVIHFWGLYIIDPILTLGLTLFILYNVGRNLRETVNILLQGVPRHIDFAKVKSDLTSIGGVLVVHDVHIWSLEGETDILSGHVVVEKELLEDPNKTRQKIKEVLMKDHIEHSTIELEDETFCSGIECKDWRSKKP